MTKEDEIFLDRINAYADKVLDHIDPQKTQVSYQLDKLKPILEEIAAETGDPLEKVFIRYMDLASERSVTMERKFQSTLGNMNTYGDIFIHSQTKTSRMTGFYLSEPCVCIPPSCFTFSIEYM